MRSSTMHDKAHYTQEKSLPLSFNFPSNDYNCIHLPLVLVGLAIVTFVADDNATAFPEKPIQFTHLTEGITLK